jgi:cytoskeletal protein RodZ
VEEKETLGKYLKRERELKRISLREVSKNTKVKEHLLKAIEENQYAALPSPTYVKGFLLAYAKYLGFDPNDILLRYENSLKEEPDIQSEVPSEKNFLGNISYLRNKRYLWIVGGIVVIGFFTSYFFLLRPPQLSMEPIPVPQKVEEPPPPAPPPPPQVSETTVPPQEQPFSLQLKAVEETWVRIKIDDQPEYEMTLKPGEVTYHQGLKRIRLLVGNAGGLDIVFKGELQKRTGKSGEVVDIAFTPQGVEAKHYVIKPKPEPEKLPMQEKPEMEKPIQEMPAPEKPISE